MKPTVNEMRLAMRDLRMALELSGIDDDGKFTCYEYNGTARVIPVAVAALIEIRHPNETALRAADDDLLRDSNFEL